MKTVLLYRLQLPQNAGQRVQHTKMRPAITVLSHDKKSDNVSHKTRARLRLRGYDGVAERSFFFCAERKTGCSEFFSRILCALQGVEFQLFRKCPKKEANFTIIPMFVYRQ